jgi:hypothetical protein
MLYLPLVKLLQRIDDRCSASKVQPDELRPNRRAIADRPRPHQPTGIDTLVVFWFPQSPLPFSADSPTAPGAPPASTRTL